MSRLASERRCLYIHSRHHYLSNMIAAVMLVGLSLGSVAGVTEQSILEIDDAEVTVGTSGTFDLPFVIRRSGNLAAGTRVAVDSRPGGKNPAVPDEDYVALQPGTEIVFQPGEEAAGINIEVFGGEPGTPDKTLQLEITDARTFDVVPRLFDAGFNAPVRGALPQSLALADLTGNGVQDAVTGNNLSLNLSVLLADGQGGFAVAETYPVTTPDGPDGFPSQVHVTVGDVTGNGHPDLVAAGYNKDVLDVFEGDGTGRFAASRLLLLGSADYPSDVALADLNGNGDLDIILAIANFEAGPGRNISVLFSDGRGGFNPLEAFPLDESPLSVTAADVTGNGHYDIVTGTDTRVFILPADGAGSFGPVIELDAGENIGGVLDVVVADLNGNGFPDIVTANRYPLQPPFREGSISVLPGTGPGQFGDAVQYAQGFAPVLSIDTADLSGNGHHDIVYVRADDRGQVDDHAGVLLADQAGNFEPPYHVTTGAAPFAIAIGDVTGNGIADVVTANASDGNISVLAGDGAGSVGTGEHYATAGRQPHSLVAADLNGSGLEDLIVVNSQSNNIAVLLNRGDGFDPAVTYPVGMSPRMVVAVDLNGDGTLDLVTANGGGRNISVLMGNGAGGFADAVHFSAGGDEQAPVALVVGDINGSGHLDVVTANNLYYQFEGRFVDSLSILLGDGNGGFSKPDVLDMGDFRWLNGIALADLTGNGVLDIVTANTVSHDLTILAGDGSGGFEIDGSLVAGETPVVVIPADVTGNGHLDLLVLNHRGQDVSVFPGHGDGDFGPESRYALSDEANCQFEGSNCPWAWGMHVADVTGNGHPDIVTANTDNHTVTVLANDGAGDFSTRANFHTSSRPRSVVVTDIDGNGNADVATVSQRAGIVSILPSELGQVKWAGGVATGTIHYGASPELSFDPASLDFGEVAVGSASAPMAAVLSNSGAHPVKELSFADPGSGMQADISACDAVLPPGESCLIEIIFAPQGTGAVDVELQASGAGDIHAAVRLTGSAFEPTEETLHLTVAVAGEGAVTVDPEQPAYLPGDVITVSAVADPGWMFAGWSGDVISDENPLVLTIEHDLSMIATFEPAGQESEILPIPLLGGPSLLLLVLLTFGLGAWQWRRVMSM